MTTRRIWILSIWICLLWVAMVGAAVTAPNATVTRVSVASDGTQGDGDSWQGDLSGDGRYVVFLSDATTLVPGNTDPFRDVMVHDLQTSETSLVSDAPDGSPGNGSSRSADISSDGRYVAFTSAARNLVLSDTNNVDDVFVRDVVAGTTVRVSRAFDGSEADDDSSDVAISASGRYVAFESEATNLVPGFHPGRNVYVHDLLLNQTTLVSVATDGTPANGASYTPAISGDGRYVVFGSDATNLVPGDTNGLPDVYLHDLQTGETTRLSSAPNGSAGNSRSDNPAISDDGHFAAFSTGATDLIPNDTNNAWDIVLVDLQSGDIELISMSSAGVQGNSGSSLPHLSANGRYVAFQSGATNLVSDDINTNSSIFVRDRTSMETLFVSPASDGGASNLAATVPRISADGRFVGFESPASNFVRGDTNNRNDVFVYGPRFPAPPVSTHIYLPLTIQ